MSTSAAFAGDEAFIAFDDAALTKGRGIWLENCKACHADGTAGAPIPMKPAQWRERLSKEKTVLYEHALNGFFGPDGTMMPERGGNPALNDEQVKAAVDYMLALARHYQKAAP